MVVKWVVLVCVFAAEFAGVWLYSDGFGCEFVSRMLLLLPGNLAYWRV